MSRALSPCARFPFALLSLALWLVLGAASARAAAPARSVAVLVGANAPAPGRAPLRYALSDAQLMADTLARTGRFASDDIVTLLEPSPGELLGALERAARVTDGADAALLVFYYSGHSDGQRLFPHGEPLELKQLRARIASAGARVRVAILDTCRGGTWTNTKG
jgi:hypothetical protein